MTSSCTGCHTTSNPGGGIAITAYDDMLALANNGSLMGSIRYENGYAPMPPNNPLSDCKIVTLQKWIDLGIPND